MRRVIVGTAGHIDHGKTTLVKALTGIDCDRWEEEKSRGITIDLGFAHLREGDLQVGFIDVPGHERFVHNALAGLGGIRVMLLVVAADEGVKPQTREHLAICSLLGIPAAVVALTKTDLVTADLVELAGLEVEELLAGTRFAGAPVLAVSSRTGDGVPELKAKLLELAAAHEAVLDAGLPARLPLDRAFHLKGLGVVVTGTLASGTVHPGDGLDLLPAGRGVRVRSVQVHGEPREEAIAGERTSLQITGIELGAVARGSQLATPGAYEATRRLLARFDLLPEAPAPIDGFVPVRLHLYSSEVMGRLRPVTGASLEPGASGIVEIRLGAPVVAIRGDRFIVRRPSPATTLGGGEILDPQWRRPRGRDLPEALSALAEGPREALVFWVRNTAERGIGDERLARRLGVPAARVVSLLGELVREAALLEVPAGAGHERRWISPAAWSRVAERARRVLSTYFARDRLAGGMPKAEALRQILPGRAGELADVYLGWLESQNVLQLEGDRVNLPGRSAQLTGEESRLSQDILERFDRGGLTPPSPGELREALGAKPQILEGVIRYLVDQGTLCRLPGGLVFSTSALDRLRAELVESGWERFSVADFKDRFGLTRKWAIPVLEHLDSTGVTRRTGDDRMVVR